MELATHSKKSGGGGGGGGGVHFFYRYVPVTSLNKTCWTQSGYVYCLPIRKPQDTMVTRLHLVLKGKRHPL